MNIILNYMLKYDYHSKRLAKVMYQICMVTKYVLKISFIPGYF